MTGLPQLNFPAFHAAAAHLRTYGYTVINPAEINPDHSMSWEACMRKDIAELVTCAAIYLLPGWQNSKGATLEHHIAERIGPTRQMQAWYDRPVFIHNIIARDTVDELVIERVNSKREVQQILLDAMKRKHK